MNLLELKYFISDLEYSGMKLTKKYNTIKLYIGKRIKTSDKDTVIIKEEYRYTSVLEMLEDMSNNSRLKSGVYMPKLLSNLTCDNKEDGSFEMFGDCYSKNSVNVLYRIYLGIDCENKGGK